jgi:hypothetical protein
MGACGRSATAPSANTPTAQPWPEADALFHQDPRWLGADVAYSVDLGGGRVLWLFGDTFVATSAADVRSQATMVHNSVAIESGYDPSRASIAFFWDTSAGMPSAFFPSSPNAASDWFWPGHGAMVDGHLVVFLSQIASSSQGLGFAAAGWRALRIDDPADAPSSWQPVPLTTPQSTMGVTFGETAFVRSGFLYVFGAEDQSPAVHLVRWPTAAVLSGDLSAPEWWTPSGWVAQASLSALPPPLFADGSTELSVQPNPGGYPGAPAWLEVQTVGFGAATLDLRTAPDFTGPWGSVAAVYTPPESALPGVLIYAGKGHPELQGAPLVATYASNNSSFNALVADTNLYYPRFVRIGWTPGD